jgi:3-oxoacyl-[acyl-carrier-protein] synthase II
MAKKRIVVTGMGIVSCFGTDVEDFYNQLLAGRSGIVPIEEFPCSDYPTRFAGVIRNFDPGEYMDKKQARRVDPFIRYAMVAGKKALESGGLVGEALTKGDRRLTPFFVPYIITNMGGALLGIDTGFMGPNYSISTACATSNYSIHSAAEQIWQGRADVMLCGGAEAAINPIGLAGFVAIKALSTRNEDPTKASRPWDTERDGFVMGEGAGVLLLESLDHALARGAPIYAEYLGGSVNCDAYHMTDPRPDGQGVALCIEEALRVAGVSKTDVNYVNAHATSTQAGDLCELNALRSVFGSHIKNMKVNATKSLIGHTLGAAGCFGSIATIQGMRTGKIHPTINLDHPEPAAADFDLVPNKAESYQINVGIANSFGFGGHNSTLVFAPYRA